MTRNPLMMEDGHFHELSEFVQAQPSLFPVDRQVGIAELSGIWAQQRADGISYNGCTSVALHKRYGDRVYHRMGVGWFVRPA